MRRAVGEAEEAVALVGPGAGSARQSCARRQPKRDPAGLGAIGQIASRASTWAPRVRHKGRSNASHPGMATRGRRIGREDRRPSRAGILGGPP